MIVENENNALWALRIATTLGCTIGIGLIAPYPFALGIIGSIAASYFTHGRHCSLTTWHQRHHLWHIQMFHLPDVKLRESPGLKITLIALATICAAQFTPCPVTAGIAFISAIAATDWIGATSYVWVNNSGDEVHENHPGVFQRFCKKLANTTLHPERQLKVLTLILNLAASYFAFSAGPLTWTAVTLAQVGLYAYGSLYKPDFLRREFEWIHRFNHPHLITAISCSSALLSNLDPVFSLFWVALQSLAVVSVTPPLLSARSKSFNTSPLRV